MPYYAWSGKRRGKQNTPDDIRQLVGFSEAKAAAAKKGSEWGVGLAMIKGSPVTALDFDRCVTQNERGDFIVKPEVDSMVVGTYAEISPSGTGIRAFVSGSVGNNRQAHHEAWDYGLELFNGTGFVTFTGNITDTTKLTGDENTVAKPTAHLLEHIAVRFGPSAAKEKAPQQDDGVFTIAPPRVGMSVDELREMLTNLDPNMSNKEWHDLGAALHHETYGSPEGCALWDEWSSEGSGYPGTQYFENRWEGFDSEHPNAIRVVSYFKAAQEGAIAQGKTWSIPRTVTPAKVYPPGSFGITSDDVFAAQQSSLTWLIKGFLPKATLGILFGESGSGKSFATLDMCAAVCRGLDLWNGHRVTKGRVLYVVAEGVSGFRQRLKAYCHQHAIPKVGMDVIYDMTPNLMDTAQITALINDVSDREAYDLIVMDTFAQSTTGADENNGKDMGFALDQCKRIATECRAMVLLVHHSGKDASKGSRGHSSLKAACDVELQVEAGNDTRSIKTSKMKDGEQGLSYIFKLHTVVLGTDDDGDDITSCIVEFKGAGQVKPEGKKKTGANELKFLDALHNAIGLADEKAGVETAKVHEEFCSQFDPTKRQSYKNQAFNRAKDTLLEKGALFEENGVLFIHARNADQ
jgi:archaellum biogenesis ATPase FlaH